MGHFLWLYLIWTWCVKSRHPINLLQFYHLHHTKLIKRMDNFLLTHLNKHIISQGYKLSWCEVEITGRINPGIKSARINISCLVSDLYSNVRDNVASDISWIKYRLNAHHTKLNTRSLCIEHSIWGHMLIKSWPSCTERIRRSAVNYTYTNTNRCHNDEL